MTHFPKLRLYPTLRWVSSISSSNPLKSQKPISICSFSSYYNYSIKYYSNYFSTMVDKVDQCDDFEGSSKSNSGETSVKITPTIRKKAQGALLEYLHSTRYLPFLDAEHMSTNSPNFLRKLMENVGNESDIKRAVARFLRYHPINEFEPFFESIGLEPCVFGPLLPRDLIYLSDEDGLLDNYRILCEYGVDRYSIGKIYMGAREVFQYRSGVLMSMLREFEELGLSKSVIAKAIIFNPCLLVEGVGKEFFKVIGKLQYLGCEYDWVEQHLWEDNIFNWRQIFELLCLLNDMGCENKDLRVLLRRHPDILFDHSGRSTFSLIGFLLKFGSTKNDIWSLFLHFPQVKVRMFVGNLRRAFQLLCDIQMDTVNIEDIIRTQFMLLGSCSVKRANSLISNLNTGKKRLCQIIIENPLVLKNWVLRAKIERLPVTKMHSRMRKIKFLASIGFKEQSKEMEWALKSFRGKGEELYGRFYCLVKAGLSEEDVANMAKSAPRILNISTEVIEQKIRCIVDDLGHPVSSLKSFPGFISYTIERIKLRCSMYKWLVNQNAVRPTLSLSTIVGCTESYFVQKYVNKHPRGLDVWQELKKTVSVL